MYFSTRRIFLPKSTVLGYYKAILSGFKKKYPKDEEIFKEIGHLVLNEFNFSLSPSLSKELKAMKENKDPKLHLKLFKKIYPSFDFIQEGLDISEVKLDENGKKAIYRFKNSELLENSKNFVYHFYMICGIIEAVFKKENEKIVLCNVEKIEISPEKENSYIDISMEFID